MINIEKRVMRWLSHLKKRVTFSQPYVKFEKVHKSVGRTDHFFGSVESSDEHGLRVSFFGNGLEGEITISNGADIKKYHELTDDVLVKGIEDDVFVSKTDGDLAITSGKDETERYAFRTEELDVDMITITGKNLNKRKIRTATNMMLQEVEPDGEEK